MCNRIQCHLEESEIGLSNCNHCGAKKWNILGNPETGYALTEDNNKYCVLRVKNSANLISCDKSYATFLLQCNLIIIYYLK